MNELEKRQSLGLLASQLSELTDKNLLSPRMLTLLPRDLIVLKLAPESPLFRQTFDKELTLLNQSVRSNYLSKVDEIFDSWIEVYRNFEP